MRRRPTRSDVQLARLVQHIFKRVLGLHIWPLWLHIWLQLPTASSSPWIFFILDSGHLPTAILSIRLLILPLSIVLLIVVIVASIVLLALLLTEPLVTGLSCLRSPWRLNNAADSELNRTHD